MGARFRSWWQQIKRPLSVIGVIAASILLIALVVGIIGGYLFNWKGTGVGQKTLWDWLQLLFIPVVLAVAGFWFNHRERKATELRAENEQKAAKFRAWNEQKAAEFRAEAEREIERQHAQTERDIAEDNQREAVLQEYINKISELLLHENLRKSEPEDEVRKIARVKTLTVLRRLDAERKGSVLQFLYEAGLISGDKDQVVIHLQEADLNGANLTRIFLNGVNLSRVNLNEAMLYRAILTNAILEFANLQRANIREADLIRCDLSNADLTEADLSGAIGTTPEQLAKAKSLRGAIMPDGLIHL